MGDNENAQRIEERVKDVIAVLEQAGLYDDASDIEHAWQKSTGALITRIPTKLTKKMQPLVRSMEKLADDLEKQTGIPLDLYDLRNALARLIISRDREKLYV
jgi:hypothetical protein